MRLGAQRHARAPPTYARRRAKLHQRLNALIAAVYADADARRLIKRLRRHRRELLTFLDHDDVSPYNNHAEQQLRPAVHTRKVSQQNRSLDGANTHAIMLSLFRTAHLQGLNPIDQVLHLAQTTLADRATSTILHTDPVSQAA